MSDVLVPVRRALLSVSDKTGLIPFASALADAGVALLSTGGTAKALREAGLGVRDVAEVTGFPEMLDGRVKTLHPVIHGGLLALRDKPEHMDALEAHGIGTIDLLVVNLYPFEATVARGADFETCVENVDIGGPAMIRAAAKNHPGVAVVTSPADYDIVAQAVAAGGTDRALRLRLAAEAYARTSAYDAAVSTWMSEQIGHETPTRRSFSGRLVQPLRYGENPHQRAAFYADGSGRPGVATAVQVQGKDLSYNNINDTDAAIELAAEFSATEGGPAAVIVKHANPCGVARGASALAAYRAAYDCDRTSAFGGIVALNTPLDAETAREITGIFTEVVIAPGASAEAKAIFAAKPNLRLLLIDEMPDPKAPRRAWRQVSGGLLVQDHDAGRVLPDDLRIVTERQPEPQELEDMMFAWRVAKHVKSNAIVYARNGATVGIGAGQMSRIDSARIAARKAEDMATETGLSETPVKGAAAASDAFFPFADGLVTLAEAGARTVIQPGGSMRDAEVIEEANRRGLAMAFTGMRHFRH